MPKPTMQTPVELVQALRAVYKVRGASVALSKASGVDMSTIRKARNGGIITIIGAEKLRRALAKNKMVVHSAQPVIEQQPSAENGLRHFAAYSGALIQGMDFMRESMLRYLVGNSE